MNRPEGATELFHAPLHQNSTHQIPGQLPDEASLSLNEGAKSGERLHPYLLNHP
jgi:hypothetical protein